jgi:hypothetical protein
VKDLKSPDLEFDEEPHEYRVGGHLFISVTQALAEAGLSDAGRFAEPWHAERGRKVHLLCHLFDHGHLDMTSIDPRLEPYFAGWPRFCLDHNWEPWYSETPLSSVLFSSTYRFAGTPDKFGKADAHWTIIEIKTGCLPRSTGLQLAGQEVLFREHAEVKAAVAGGSIRRAAVLLPGDGTYKMVPYEDHTDRNVFFSAVAIANWKRRK